MRKSQLVVMIALFTILVSTSLFAAEASTASAATSQVSGVVNLNTADATQLAYLPRVGEKAAQRILEYRKEHGSFRKPTDLMQVKGFGQKTFDLVAPYITVEGKTTLASKVSSPRKPRAKSSRQQPANTASE